MDEGVSCAACGEKGVIEASETVVTMVPPMAPIAMLTAYDFPFARIFDAAGVDVLLVGDSLGMVVQGADNTLAVTLDEVIYHTRMVARARQRALVVADLPFLTYQVSVEKALANSGRLIKESGAEAVKLEGGITMAETIRHIV
jgi:3-methyl-2-oxobutanoate hydroxymethyltransferase